MSYIKFLASNGREVEIEITAVNIRTPGRPMPRDFTCTAQLDKQTAYVKLGSAHTDAGPLGVKRALDEALASLGVRNVDYEHNDKTINYEIVQ